MGKGTGLFGNFRKKVGNTVGYTLKNSNNAQTQGVRIYQPVVSNPKSDPQSAQRMKLMPLQIFYQAFGDVLNHAFEGKKVGQMNRQRFMQLNMGANSGIAPAVQKGERILAPIKCQVSSGSLTIDTTMVQVGVNSLAASNLIYDNGSHDDSLKTLTVKQFSEAMIANNLGLEDGMEVAVIAIVSRDEDPRGGVPFKFYVVLNTADDITTIADCMGNVANYLDISSEAGGALTINAIAAGTTLLGAAIIISRKNASGWSNNNARFYVTAAGESIFYNEGLYLAALATYGPNGSTLVSDLFLQQADNASGASNPNAVMGTESASIVLTGDYEDGVLSVANALLATLRSGVKAIVVNRSGEIVDADGEVITVTVGTGDDEVTSNLTPAMTTFAGLKQVNYASF